jgi:hypothetical protein
MRESVVTGEVRELVNEVSAVKNLLILQALALGCQQKHIAAALGISEATVSRIFPKGFAKEVSKIAAEKHRGAPRE